MGEKRLTKGLADRPDLKAGVLQPGVPEGDCLGLSSPDESSGVRTPRRRPSPTWSGTRRHPLRFRPGGERAQYRGRPRPILFAGEHGLQREVADALLRAYFAEDKDMKDYEGLIEVACEAGLDTAGVRKYLAGGGGTSEARSGREEERRLGITGVPFYVFVGRYALYGARPRCSERRSTR